MLRATGGGWAVWRRAFVILVRQEGRQVLRVASGAREQGTFNFDDDARGHTDTRWQTLAELTEYCSREDFEKLSGAYIKELQKTFRRDAKKFKTAAQLRAEE